MMSSAAQHGRVVRAIQPCKPLQDAYMERVHRAYRTEVLDAFRFTHLAEVRAVSFDFLHSYNTERPHGSLGRTPPPTLLPRPTALRESPSVVST